jgi:hypothetical protein
VFSAKILKNSQKPIGINSAPCRSLSKTMVFDQHSGEIKKNASQTKKINPAPFQDPIRNRVFASLDAPIGQKAYYLIGETHISRPEMAPRAT